MRDAYCAIDCLVAFMHPWALKHFHKGLLHTRACDCDLTLSYRSQVVDNFNIFYLTFFAEGQICRISALPILSILWL